MALFRRFFYRKPPDRLLEISERVYVFDCCFSSDVMEEDEYKVYMGGIVTQLQDYSPEASFMVFNFREGEKRSQISDILSQYDMTVMDYPRQYEGCPMLPLEMIHHFLKSSESWLSLEGQQNVLLMHCERGGWPVLAFMLAGLLLYRKQYSGEQKTLEMVYKQAPRELLHMLSPLNPQPTQLRYLQYISRRNIGSDWPPSDTPLLLDCLILRLAPILEGGKGCRPLVRVYGQDPSTPANRSSKLLYSTSKTKKRVRHYAQSECALVKMDIFCRVQGDVVLECVHLDEQLVREEMMFRIAFHTAFVRSNILIFNRDEVDLLWDARNQFPRDFKAEVLFMDADAVVPNLNTDASGEDGNETEGTLPEEFFEVEEIFVDVHEGKMEVDNTHEGRKKIGTRTAPVGAKTTHGSPPPPPSPPPPSPFLSQRAPPPSPQLASNNLPPTYGMPPLPLPPLTRGGLPPPPPPSLAYEALAPPPLQTHGGPPPSPPLSRGELLSPPPPPLRGGPPPPPPSQSRGGPPPPPLPPLRRGLPQPLRAPSPPAPPLHGAPPLPGEAPPPPPPPLGRAPPPSPTSRGRAPDPPAPPRPPGGGSPPPPGVLGTRPPGPPAAPLPGGRGRGFPRPLAPASKKSSLKPLHWSKVTRALQGSLWDELQRYGESDMMAEFDVSELETLFSASVPKPADKSGGRRKTISSKPEKVNLIDMRRAYNTEIMLTKVKIPLPDMMTAVLALDEAVLDVDQAENLIKFCPTKEEMELLKNYTGDKNNLGKCEQYFMELMKVPRVESKLRVFSFKIQFRTQITEFRKNLSTVNCACEEVRNSFKLKEIMRRILFLGNVLNQGTARGSAIGFKMDSLLKLTDTRATNNKMTLMHFLCKKLADWSPELLDFHQDFSSLEAASKIQLKSLAEEMQAIIKGLEKVMQELAASENDGPVSETFRKTLTGFIGQAEGGVASLTNLYLLVGRNADALILYFNEDPTRCPFEQVTVTLLNFVKLFRKAHEENCKQAEMEKKKAEKEAEVKKAKSVSHAKRSQNI